MVASLSNSLTALRIEQDEQWRLAFSSLKERIHAIDERNGGIHSFLVIS